MPAQEKLSSGGEGGESETGKENEVLWENSDHTRLFLQAENQDTVEGIRSPNRNGGVRGKSEKKCVRGLNWEELDQSFGLVMQRKEVFGRLKGAKSGKD